jgi:hypothetical protein
MKSKKTSIFIIVFTCLVMTGCVVSNTKLFSEVQITDDLTYGYTIEKPITIKNGDPQNSIRSSYYYLSRLRAESGNKLQLISRSSVINPNYREPAIPLYNRYTGQPLTQGEGMMIDLYVLVPENESDTIRLYINSYKKDEIKVPVGLKFEQ